jgi:hypothetical protein
VLYEALNSFFESGWFVARNDEEQFLRLIYLGKKGVTWTCYAQAQEDEHMFIFYSVWPDNVAEEKRLAMAELLTLINYGLKIGNFEMDFDDGEIRYKTSVMLEDDAWAESNIKPVVFFNVGMMDQYTPCLKALQDGDSTPAEAAALIDD